MRRFAAFNLFRAIPASGRTDQLVSGSLRGAGRVGRLSGDEFTALTGSGRPTGAAGASVVDGSFVPEGAVGRQGDWAMVIWPVKPGSPGSSGSRDSTGSHGVGTGHLLCQLSE